MVDVLVGRYLCLGDPLASEERCVFCLNLLGGPLAGPFVIRVCLAGFLISVDFIAQTRHQLGIDHKDDIRDQQSRDNACADPPPDFLIK